ncbi:MAG TPA: ATP-binding protein [Caulobacteraceae bacterium]|nr:ATP-binding protein [Caulobacteraceae bacterium]
MRQRRPPTTTLFAQVLALIVFSLLGAMAIDLFVVFNLPPPTPEFYRLGEIAQLLKQGPGATSAEKRPLVVSLRSAPPKLSDETPLRRFVPPARRELATLLGVDPSRVVINSGADRFSDRRAFQMVRSELAKNGQRTEDRFLIAPFEVGLAQPGGHWLVAAPKPSLEPTPWQQRLALWFLLSAAALTPIAYLFAGRLARPIAQFAEAAERLGRDPGAPPLDIQGSTEIRVATAAFNEMQERLARYVQGRTAMVGAIAHDLRTPLTRLRFRLEAAPPELRAKMAADVGEMEQMISGVLAFVRDSTLPTTRTRLELSSLLESVVDDMSETGLDVAVEQADRVVVDGDTIALRRLFNNLLDNAVKFGVSARVRVFAEGPCAVVEIDDRGAGLPKKALEQVFEPFYRYEGSRSRETGGIGLGLAVVRSIAQAHGGEACLHNRDRGGLTARVKLPLSPNPAVHVRQARAQPAAAPAPLLALEEKAVHVRPD